EPEHQTVADGVQSRTYTQLGHTGSSSAAGDGRGRGRRTADESKAAVIGRNEVGMEHSDLVGTATWERDKGIARADRREIGAVEVGRQESPSSSRDSWGDKSGGHAGKHFRPVKGKRLGTEKGGASGVEDVVGLVVAVGPDTEMRVI